MGGRRRIDLDRIGDEDLLDTRICDLPVRIEGELLELLGRLHEELAERGLRLKPHAWLSEEWFSPDGVPGIAIPFYLAHPRLTALERRLMLDAEGAGPVECLRILRHEAGHAMDAAFRLHHRRRWRELFGSFTTPYPDAYSPRPGSRRYVLHLDSWYAQAHPAEDFAETFATWLAPGSRWRQRYAGWPALAKLEYVDELMAELRGRRAPVRSRQRVDPISGCTRTLREHYASKLQTYRTESSPRRDGDLKRVFSDHPRHAAHETAASWLRRTRRELIPLVSAGTGVHPYTIRHVLLDMMRRCQDLKLRIGRSERRTRLESLVLLTALTMNAVHGGHHRFAV